MADIIANRVLQTTTTTGTGAIALSGTPTGFQSFQDVMSDGDTCYYVLQDDSSGDWEIGSGTYSSSGNSITRTTILNSSNSNSAVNLSAGTKQIFISIPASKTIIEDPSGDSSVAGDFTVGGALSLGTDLALAHGGTGASDAATARTNLGLGSMAEQNSASVAITGGTIAGITDLAIADGGTGASTASAARTNLGLVIGTDVQAYDPELQALSGLTPTDGNFIVGNGSTFVTENASTARTSLGLGSIATQSSSGVSISGGSITGITDLAIADGGTGASDAATARTNLGLGSLATASSINNSNWSGTDLAVANGGTGASDAATARSNLGLGSLATASSISNSNWSGTDLTIANGGTGASDAATARTNLGLGSIATQAANSVAITGGTLSGLGNVAVNNGYGYLWGSGAVQMYSDGNYLRMRTASTDRLEIDSSGHLTSYGRVKGKGFAITGESGARVTMPDGAIHTQTGSQATGAIKIRLPFSWNNAMIRFTVKIYEYTTGESFEVSCGGYLYSGGSSWANTFAYEVSQWDNNRNFTVRFGHDGTYCCVTIGETNSTWSYPQVFVTDFQNGYSGFSEGWMSGWDISFVTSLPTITQTHSNTSIYNNSPRKYGLGNASYYSTDTWIEWVSTTAGLYWGSGGGAGWHFHPANQADMNLQSGYSGVSRLNFKDSTGTTRGIVAGNSGSGYDSISIEDASNNKRAEFRSNGANYIYGSLDINSGSNIKLILSGSANPYIQFRESSTDRAYIQYNSTNNALQITNQETGDTANVGYVGYQLGLEGSRNEKIVLRGASNPYIRFMESTAEKGYLQWNSAGYMRLVNQADGITVDWGDGYDQKLYSSNDAKLVLDGSTNPYIRFRENGVDKAFIQWSSSGYLTLYNQEASGRAIYVGGVPSNSFALQVNGYVDMGGNWIYQGVGAGIYSPQGHYLYTESGRGWQLRSALSTTAEIKLQQNNGTVLGWYYADNISQGFLTTGGSWVFRVEANGNNKLWHKGYARINDTGMSNPSYPLDVVGDIRATGDVISDSDIRHKTDIRDIEDALQIVMALRGVYYTKNDTPSVGVIAQEVEPILPQVVHTADDEDQTKSVSYGNMIAVMLEAIKEQQERIEQLEARIN